MNRTMIELEEDTAVGFLQHGEKYWEYLPHFFTLDFPELTEGDYDDFVGWADQKATFTHRSEYEYIFPIAYWDNTFLKNIEVPDKFRPIFRALVKIGKTMNKDRDEENKIIPHLHICLPK